MTGRLGMGLKVKRILQGTLILAMVLALQLRVSTAEAGTPVANAGGPYSGDEGEIITFTGGAVDAEDPESSMTFEWDFDFNGTFSANKTGVNLVSPTHTYSDDGTFSVALRVTDTNSNVSPIVSATVTIGNVPPSAGSGGPYSVDEGSALSFNGSATDPGNDTLTYEWDFDYDGQTFTVDASGEDLTSPSNTYNNDGTKTAALRVRDDDGGVSTIRTAAVTISNVPPTANAGSSYSVNEGSQLTFSGSANDPGSDTLTYEWDFTYSGGQFNTDTSGDALTDPKNTYNDDGSFTVALRVRDDDSTSQVATASVTVTNVLPTANAGGPYSGSVGSPVTFAGSATDPGNDALTYEWDFEYDGQSFKTTGSSTQSGVNLTAPKHTYGSEGSYTVALRVQDDDGASGTVTSTVTISAGGATATPTATSVPTSSGGGGGGGGGGSTTKVATSTPKPTKTPTPKPATATPAPEPTPEPDAETTKVNSSSEPITATIDTSIVVSSSEVSTFEASLGAVIGEAVQVASTVLAIESTADGSIVIGPKLTGVTEVLEIVGDLNVTLGNLTLETTDGLGTAVIALSEGLKIEGAAVVDITNQGLDVIIDDPRLVFKPAVPDVATLTGGSDKVTNIGANFEVGLKQIRDNTSVSVRFSKDANTVVEDAEAKLISAAGAVGGVLEDPVRDVAFAVDVDKTGITNDDLGDNRVTMEVNRQWFDEKIAEGKSMAITKFSESGAKFTTLATCESGVESAKCSASFTGIAGGFSVFVLMGVRRNEATPTATAFVAPPTATATVRPTATAFVRPTSTSIAPTATATQFSSVASAVVEPTSTSTRVPPTSTVLPTATAVTFASAAPGSRAGRSSADTSGTTVTDDSDGGFPMAAFLGILVGALALFGGGFAYAWKTGLLAENKWARKVIDMVMGREANEAS